MTDDPDVSKLLRRLALDENAKALVIAKSHLYNPLLAAARPYIGGESRAEALTISEALNRAGHAVTIDYMGESARDLNTVELVTAEFEKLAEDISVSTLNASISLDLSHIGLLLDSLRAENNLVSLAASLATTGREIIVSAEGADRVDEIIQCALSALARQSNIGVTVQAYLPRTLADVVQLCEHGPSVIRVVKGAFDAPPGAYLRGAALNAVYLKLVKEIVGRGVPVSVATHDPDIIDAALAGLMDEAINPTLVRFELLLGIREDQLERLSEAGVKTQVYVTYGSEWFLYLCNRLAEHPPSIVPALARALSVAGY